MKGSLPKTVYVLMTLSGILILVLGSIFDVNVSVTAVGAGLFACGVNRLVGEWRVKKDPDYARKQEIANQDERLVYIADKSRSLTLGIATILLAVVGIILISVGLEAYGNCCVYVVWGICALHLIIYRVVSHRY